MLLPMKVSSSLTVAPLFGAMSPSLCCITCPLRFYLPPLVACSSHCYVLSQWLMDKIQHPTTTFSRKEWEKDFKKSRRAQRYLQQFPSPQKGGGVKREQGRSTGEAPRIIIESSDGEGEAKQGSLPHGWSDCQSCQALLLTSSSTPLSSDAPISPVQVKRRRKKRGKAKEQKEKDGQDIEESREGPSSSTRPFDKPPALLLPSPMRRFAPEELPSLLDSGKVSVLLPLSPS